MSYVEEFLRSVLPASGRYCVVGITTINGKKQLRHVFVDTIEEAKQAADRLDEADMDVYFALATFGGENRRLASNAVSLRSFFLDLDSGPDKPYADPQEALQDLHRFVVELGLPEPSIVSSGHGVHAYWPLDTELPVGLWQPLASRFKAKCNEVKLGIDNAVPDDIVRILRVPGTRNHKYKEDIRPVTLVRQGEGRYALTTFEAVLGSNGEMQRIANTVEPVSAATAALTNYPPAKFSTIARKSLSGTGCNALRHIMVHQTEVEEPLWYSGLSIAQHCLDAEEAIHVISKFHPEYNRADTIRKAQGAKHPHNCDKFRSLAPELCAGCALNIRNPIVLGVEVERAEPVEPPEEEIVYERELTLEDVENVLHSTPTVAFSPPFPYFRKAGGGIYREDRDENDAKVEVKVYEHDLFATQRLLDPNDGEVVVFKLRLPQDQEREFSIPLAEIHAPNLFKNIAGKNGVVGTQKQMQEIMNYAIRYAKELQLKGRAREARLQFGWTEKRDGFVVGNRLYRASKVLHNPASSTTADMLPWFEPKGSLATWKAVVNSLAQPGLEPLQMGVLAGFASPLMPFTGFAGVMINLMSNESGTGKTTALRFGLSVFGDPTRTAFLESDTINSIEHKLGVHNNLLAGIDELTNAQDIYVSNTVYSISNGRGKDRMEAHSNKLRANATRWQLLALSNSNSSLVSKLARLKARPDGEMMRLIEIPVDRVVVPYGDQIFAQLNDTFGVAGPVYAQWLVRNVDSLTKLIDRQRERFWSKLGKRVEERFIVSAFSALVVGGRVSVKLGLHDLNIDAFEHWLMETLLTLRDTMVAEIGTSDTMVGEFLNENANAIIGVNKKILNPLTGSHVFYSPRAAHVVARFELDPPLNAMYVAKNAFRDYCVERQYTMSEVLKSLSAPNLPYRYVGPKKKRMLADSGVMVPAVDALVFECRDDEAKALQQVLERNAKHGDTVES
jgi:hypothetical protein